MKKFKTHSASPLFLFFAVLCLSTIGFFYWMLKPDSSANDPLIGHPIPDITLPLLIPSSGMLNTLALPSDRPVIIHFFASWCSKCVSDHQHLMELADQPEAYVIGIVLADKPENASRWLQENGNPYMYVAIDANQTLTTSLGMRGLPDTIVIDKQRIIRARLRGPQTIHGFNKAIALASTPLNAPAN